MKTGRIFALALALACLALGAAACNKAGKSPTGTAQAFYKAAKSKDVAGIKYTLSKRTLQLMEQAAKQENKSLDQWLKEKAEAEPPTEEFEVRNEKINGDMGTLEVKDKGRWITYHFVKEDGLWKWDALMTAQGAAGGGDMGDGGTTTGGGGGGEHGGH